MGITDGLVAGSQRHQVRERAMGLLYEAETKGIAMADLVASLELPLDAYAYTLVMGAAAQQPEIDARLEKLSESWSVARMPALDRAILRLASYELACSSDISVAVIINEAVELAKAYSTKASSGFVNGVLSKVATQVR
ncbi:MAG: transcription antitermination factor NusB [bacterium]|nr:transcription antitermination factor NusB [bacterium]